MSSLKHSFIQFSVV